jgi:hypothetical protein
MTAAQGRFLMVFYVVCDGVTHRLTDGIVSVCLMPVQGLKGVVGGG